MSLFRGSGVAIITPFTQDGIDFNTFEQLIEFQIQNGTDAIIVCGTTGEPATMTSAEKQAVISFCVKQVNHRVPVIAGCGSNCTRTSVENAISAYNDGVDGLLIVTPYYNYNKCNKKGLIQHFSAIASATPLPCIIYNVPSRTGLNITPDVMSILAEIPNITAVKEASGNISQIMEIARLCPDLDVYSGDDGMTVPVLSVGGIGVISVVANIIPNQMHQLCKYWADGNISKALEMQLKYNPLICSMFCEVNPVPVKTALRLMGYSVGSTRLPLYELEDINLENLKKTLHFYSLI